MSADKSSCFVCSFLPEVLKKTSGFFHFTTKGNEKNVFYRYSPLNSMEVIMRTTPHTIQRGGGRNRSPYRYIKKDCDYRLCLYYRKKEGCTASFTTVPLSTSRVNPTASKNARYSCARNSFNSPLTSNLEVAYPDGAWCGRHVETPLKSGFWEWISMAFCCSL